MWCSGDGFLHHDNAPANDGYPSSSIFTRPCAMRLFPVPSYEIPDVSKVKKKMPEVLNNISTEEFQKCFQQWEKRGYKCIESKGEYFEGD